MKIYKHKLIKNITKYQYINNTKKKLYICT